MILFAILRENSSLIEERTSATGMRQLRSFRRFAVVKWGSRPYPRASLHSAKNASFRQSHRRKRLHSLRWRKKEKKVFYLAQLAKKSAYVPLGGMA
jgi:hypothetical protein